MRPTLPRPILAARSSAGTREEPRPPIPFPPQTLNLFGRIEHPHHVSGPFRADEFLRFVGKPILTLILTGHSAKMLYEHFQEDYDRPLLSCGLRCFQIALKFFKKANAAWIESMKDQLTPESLALESWKGGDHV